MKGVSMFTHTFFRLFPPPKFLDRQYAGLDISDDAVRAIQFKQGKHGLEVSKYGCKMFAKGMIEAGYIKDEAGVTKIIAELAHGLGLQYVRASLPEEKMYLFKTEVPSLDPKEIRQNIEFKLEENVPLSPADAVFYFRVVPSDGSGKHSATVSVAPRKVIDTYMNVLNAAGIIPIAFEIDAQSLARAFVPTEHPDTELIVNIMARKTGIYIISEGVVSFTSTVPWGGDMLTESISKSFSISIDEAEKMKRSAGYHDSPDTKKIFSAASSAITMLEQEIRKVHIYWSEHGDKSKDFDRLILCGSDALLVGLMSHISPDPSIPVQVADIWANAFSSDRYIPPISHDDSLEYAVAAGLALP